jgi:WXG100 family type VII secretion target
MQYRAHRYFVDNSSGGTKLSTQCRKAIDRGSLLRRFGGTHPTIEEGDLVSGFRVTPQQLTSLGSTCNRTAADVRGQHTVLKSQLSPLFGTDWSGSAAAQFTELYEQFNANALGMTEALDGIGRLLAQAGQSYASVEQQIASSFRR